jgi:hypothetical protein
MENLEERLTAICEETKSKIILQSEFAVPSGQGTIMHSKPGMMTIP